MKNKSKREFDFSNLSVSNVPLYALLALTAVVFAISCLGAFILPDSQNYIKYAIEYFAKSTYRFSYNSMDHYVMLACGFIIGVYQFIFLHNRDYARAVLVKAEKRQKIFKEKIILPIIALIVITLFIKSIALVENIKIFGTSSLLFSSFVAHTLIIIVHAIFGFTAGAVGTLLSGTIAETLVGGAAIILLPKAILRIADTTASRFLHGYASFYSTQDEFATFIDPTRQIFERTSDYSVIYKETATTPTSSIIHSVVWLLISFVILFFLKKFFSKNYKFEKIGFINANKLLTTIICFSGSVIIGYYTFSLLIDFAIGYYDLRNPYIESAVSSFDSLSAYNTITPLIVFVIISLLLSVIINLILTRKLKDFKHKLFTLAIIVVVFFLTTIISVTGCFGYANRLPDSEEIVSVEVCPPYIIAPTQFELIGSNNYSDGDLDCQAAIIMLNQKEDIEFLQKLHLSAIENPERETNDGLKIEYHLKDGSTLKRNYFYLSEETSKEVLKLWDTKEVKSNYELILLNKKYNNPVSAEELNHYYSNYFEGTPDCYITSKDGTRTALKNVLSAKDFAQLRKAIYKDISTMTSDQWFKPETSFGMLSFNDEEYSEEAMNKKLFMFSGIQILIPVTSETKNTVEFLKEKDLFKYLENYETNFEAYLFDVNSSEYWKSGYQSFGINAMNESELFNDISDYFSDAVIYNTSHIIDKNEPLTHSTMFTTEFSIRSSEYGNVSNEHDKAFKENLQELVDLGYATKLSESTAQEYFEKSHFKYYSGTGGNLLLVYYPDRGTTQMYILP